MQKEDHRTRVAAERRDRMRRRLFESAIQLVARKGPAATSIDDVIQAAEVSRGTFYKYFDAPDTLFDALALEVMNDIIRMAEAVVVHFEDPAHRVSTGMRLAIRLAMANREVAGFLVRLGWPEMRGGRVLLDFVKRDLELGMRHHRFADMPMRLATNIVSMTVLGSVHAMLPTRSPKDFTEQAVASALRALGVEGKDAVRIATLELPVPEPLEGGLLAPWTTARAVRRQAPARKRATASELED
ncbi:TetR/AcrR family transcriptional regulator [Variovorax paradoxus]|uniref:TetR/AcrR family transcriptional regulator n=1 Tax=Variovorax paradoxus TaxID=34073 RepID=UPI003D650357